MKQLTRCELVEINTCQNTLPSNLHWIRPSHVFLRTFCGDQLQDASGTLNTVRQLSSLLRRRLHQITEGLNSEIESLHPTIDQHDKASINVQAGLIQAAEFPALAMFVQLVFHMQIGLW